MDQSGIFPNLLWSVSDLNRYLRDIFESDDALQDLFVQGEISNLARPASGHFYFTLKDASSSLRCVMWKSFTNRIPISIRDGLSVEAHGSLGIYEVAGQYQLYVDRLKPAGEGALYQEFLRLKSRLEKEGLFDLTRKRAIPRFPQKIGIVTSQTGAALRDILNTIQRRFPPVEVVISPTLVQGVDAPSAIIGALQNLTDRVKPDLILIARGGGSIEDLWAFNDEDVAREIAKSTVPIITGIGHETDFTIADFVSDLRAPTPTAAAELATPNRSDLITVITDLTTRLDRVLVNSIIDKRSSIRELQTSIRLRSPIQKIKTFRQRLDETSRLLDLALRHFLQIRRTQLHSHEQRFAALHPFAVLSRGYAIVTKREGGVLTSIYQVKSKEILKIQLSDGEFQATADGELD